MAAQVVALAAVERVPGRWLHRSQLGLLPWQEALLERVLWPLLLLRVLPRALPWAAFLLTLMSQLWPCCLFAVGSPGLAGLDCPTGSLELRFCLILEVRRLERMWWGRHLAPASRPQPWQCSVLGLVPTVSVRLDRLSLLAVPAPA